MPFKVCLLSESYTMILEPFWGFLGFQSLFSKFSPNVTIHGLTIKSQANRTFYVMDCLAGGLTSLLDSFHDIVDSFCVNFTLFCHLQVVNFRIFQSWNLITCSFWCHAGFVSKVGQWKYANDQENMSEIYCAKFHWLDSSDNRLALRKRMGKHRWLTLYFEKEFHGWASKWHSDIEVFQHWYGILKD